MPNRTCPSCSQPVFADDSFCTHCGVRLSDGSLPEEQPGAPSPAQAESATIWQEIGQLKRELQEAGQLLNRLQESLVAIQRSIGSPVNGWPWTARTSQRLVDKGAAA